MIVRPLATLAFIALTMACHSATSGDYAVYTAALDSLVIRAHGDPTLALISPTVGDGPEGMASVEKMRDDPDVPAEVRRDFMAKNSARVPLIADSLRLSVPIRVMPADSIEAIAGIVRDFWGGIISRYPGTNRLVQLSRVGFNADSTEALLYLAWSCPGECGSGWKVRLQRPPKGAWRVMSTDLSWIQ
jgi:hypothetical protein